MTDCVLDGLDSTLTPCLSAKSFVGEGPVYIAAHEYLQFACM